MQTETEPPGYSLFQKPINLPHPALNFEDHKQQLRKLYDELATGTRQMLTGLRIWEIADAATRNQLEQQLENLPGTALVRYEASYFELAAKHRDFFVWASLHNHDETKRRLNDLT